MAVGDIFQHHLYGNNNSNMALGNVNLQWHITVDCDQKCKHCYMYESETYQSEKKNPLSLENCFRLVDQYDEILDRIGTISAIHITGGDPILRPDFWELLEYIKKKNISIVIMGNPFHISDEVAKRLKKNGVIVYQISLDGLEETHDYYRKKGSFKDSIRALEVLNKYGISTNVMFTLSKQNASELIPLYRFISKLDFVDSFSFDRLVPEGSGSFLAKKGAMTAKEHRDLLYEMFLTEVDIDPLIFQGKKDQMWRPLLYEMGLIKPFKTEEIQFCQGCGIPFGHLTVLADGTIYSCRRLPLKIGKFPEDHLWDLFIHNPVVNQFREIENYQKCRHCELVSFCRGCPAVNYGFHGDPFKPDPHCWRKINKGR